MTPYVQREVFKAFDQVVWGRARRAVNAIGNEWGNELRCHELARAVHRLLDLPVLTVIDGQLGAIEHTWLELIVPVPEVDQAREGRKARKAIIDVYTPGRLPQVQLIDPFPLMRPLYEPGPVRTDVRLAIVEQLYQEMRANYIRELERGR